MLYFDNAATSFPKPEGVSKAMVTYLETVGASINRGVYGAAQEAGLVTMELRQKLCSLLGSHDLTHCILTPGATWGLNMILVGALREGDHCLVSSVEHNAVMRPLHELARRGVTFDRIPCDGNGQLNLSQIEPMIQENTRLAVIAHGSNVSGRVQDVEKVAKIFAAHQIPLVLDAAQTAGHIPISFDDWGLSALVAPGHKGLLGPSGIGVMLLSEEFAGSLAPVITGGTGSRSHEEQQPDYMPDKFEPGTPNLPGIYGLSAAVDFLMDKTITAVEKREKEMLHRFLSGIKNLPSLTLAGGWEEEHHVGVVSLDFIGKDNGEVSDRLEQEFGILTRCGLHCAPSAHKTLGTYPQGTVRFSMGVFTTDQEIDRVLDAIKKIVCS